jgi:metallophosphoesterase superfamily enzyme
VADSECVIPQLPRVDLSARDENVELCVISDLHFGAEDHHSRQWKEDKAYILSKDPATCRVLVLGDLTQMDTKGQKHGGVYQQKSPDEQINEAARELKEIAAYVDVVLAGNHDERVSHTVGLDAASIIASLAGVASRYVRDNALIIYAVGRNNKGGTGENVRPVVYGIYAYHGDKNSSARTSLERAGNLVLADAYVSGHTHDPIVFTDRFYVPVPENAGMSVRERIYMGVGGYQLGRGYALRANLRPRKYGMGRLVLHTGTKRVEARL